MASVFFPEIKDVASIAIIGEAYGPTSIAVANTLGPNYVGAITAAAYSYMGIGMLVIFIVIGIIILSTKLINFLFSDTPAE